MNDELQAREEAKRERSWNPQQRWRVLQQTIAWVDSQQRMPRNSPAACLVEERRKLQQSGTGSSQ